MIKNSESYTCPTFCLLQLFYTFNFVVEVKGADLISFIFRLINTLDAMLTRLLSGRYLQQSKLLDHRNLKIHIISMCPLFLLQCSYNDFSVVLSNKNFGQLCMYAKHFQSLCISYTPSHILHLIIQGVLGDSDYLFHGYKRKLNSFVY